MEPSHTTWLLLVDHNFRAIGTRFTVLTSSVDLVETLKEKAKTKRPRAFSRADADPADTTMWKTMGKLVINKSNAKNVVKILKGINVDDEDTIEELLEDATVADLQLSDGETLLVRMPYDASDDAPKVALNEDPSVGQRVTSPVHPEYEDMILRATTKGNFTVADMHLNDIRKARPSAVPEFVLEFENRLSLKRRTKMSDSAKLLLGNETVDTYLSTSQTRTTSDRPLADLLEIQHLALITVVDGVMSEKIANNILFKEADANWVFFNVFAYRLESKNPNFSTKFGQEPWSFLLIIKVEDASFTYRPKSDFLVLKCGLPRMAVEVNSYPPGSDPLDHHRLMLQGACIVRFANKFLDAYKEKKNFIFVTIFMGGNGEAKRRILYQSSPNDRAVYYKERLFDIKNNEGRVQFALELYNFASALDAEKGDEDAIHKVDELTTVFNKRSNLPAFTGKTKRTGNNGGESQRSQNDRRKGGDGGGTEQLEASGYKVVPHVFETDGGTWELLDKPPPHIHIVYRRDDPNKIEKIAKVVREGSREPDIFNFLRMTGSRSPHVISPIETITSGTKKWLILPKMLSIDRRFINHAGVGARSALGWGLIKGLAYLHKHNIAHRDIKPDNLVCDSRYCLQIIDLDVAIQVEDEDTEIDEYRGTEGWTAPEMGNEDGPTAMHSPIRADRWSCGRVLLEHMKIGEGDNGLSKIAHRLMARDPRERPSLVEWQWRVSRTRRDTMEVDGGSMRAPGAKKPRLERDQMIGQNCSDIPEQPVSVY